MAKEINLNYIECAGVRVPSDYSVAQLAEALAKRNIRFGNEKEIMATFGDAVALKASLESKISELQAEVVKWDKYVKEKKQKALCPKCGALWTEAPAAIKPKPKQNKKTACYNREQ